MLQHGKCAAVIALLSLCGVSPSCGPAPPPPEIRIGVLAILDGVPRLSSGLPTIRGAQLAADLANADGGVVIGGVPHRVTLVIKVYRDRPDSATSVARALINQEQIDAMVGPQFSRHAIPVSVVAENARMPMVSPMSSSPATTEGKSCVFRLAFLDNVQGAVMGRFASQELSATRAAVLYDVSTAYGRNLAAVFREAFEAEGGEIVAFEAYTRDEALEFGEQLARIKSSDADVLYLPNDGAPVRAQVAQTRDHGIDATLLGGDTWDMEDLKTRPAADGAYVAHQWHYELDLPEAQRFVELYREAHDENPKVTAAMTFDAVNLLLRAMRTEDSKDAEAIKRGLAGTNDYEGATGTISFRGRPDPERSVVISTLENGISKPVRVVEH